MRDWNMNTSKSYALEVREQTVRLSLDYKQTHCFRWVTVE